MKFLKSFFGMFERREYKVVVVSFFGFHRYLRHECFKMKFNKNRLFKIYHDKEEVIEIKHNLYQSLYDEYKTENLYIFFNSIWADISDDIIMRFCFVYEDYNDNVKADLNKFISKHLNKSEFVKTFIQLFGLKDFPEYLV